MRLKSMVLWLVFMLNSIALCASYTLDMNCTSEGLTGADCMNYMREYINNYVLVEKKYNKQTLPVEKPYWGSGVPSPGDVYDVLSTQVQLTMKNLVSLDSAAGTMTTAVFLDIYWRDHLLSWDPQWTDGYEFFDIDYTLIWTPDLLLYNAVGKFSDQMGKPALFLSSNGNAWWDAAGLLTFSCNFDIVKFPFDTQTCSAIFGSWTYAAYEMNITQSIVVVDSAFSNIAWEVESVSSVVNRAILWEIYPYDFAVYTFQVGRYYNHYVSNAIIPSLLVTSLSLISLWIDDVGVRLSIGITALLALIAVQWTVSSEIPVSNDEPWLSKLSNVCIVYTTMVCVEGYIIGYLRRKHERALENGDHNIPYFFELFIDFSRWLDKTAVRLRRKGVFLAFMLCGAAATAGASFRANSAAHGTAHSSSAQRRKDEETGRESSMSTAVELTTNPMSSKRFTPDGGDKLPAAEPVEDSRGSDVGSSDTRDSDVKDRPAKEDPESYEHSCSFIPFERRYSWDKATEAVDHLSRVAMPSSYCLIVIVFFAEVS